MFRLERYFDTFEVSSRAYASLPSLMAIVTDHEVKKAFDEILHRVEQGEDIVITKQDRPIARMIPESKRNLDQVRRAVDNIRAHRRAMLERGFGPLTDEEIRAAIHEGRR